MLWLLFEKLNQEPQYIHVKDIFFKLAAIERFCLWAVAPLAPLLWIPKSSNSHYRISTSLVNRSFGTLTLDPQKSYNSHYRIST
jgi:hypothetical protein